MATAPTYTENAAGPALGDLLQGSLPWVVGPAVLFPMFPGFLLCVPGLIFAALVLIPVIAGAVVLALAAAIVELLVRLARWARGVTSAAELPSHL